MAKARNVRGDTSPPLNIYGARVRLRDSRIIPMQCVAVDKQQVMPTLFAMLRRLNLEPAEMLDEPRLVQRVDSHGEYGISASSPSAPAPSPATPKWKHSDSIAIDEMVKLYDGDPEQSSNNVVVEIAKLIRMTGRKLKHDN